MYTYIYITPVNNESYVMNSLPVVVNVVVAVVVVVVVVVVGITLEFCIQEVLDRFALLKCRVSGWLE